jgi:O-antigen ligase
MITKENYSFSHKTLGLSGTLFWCLLILGSVASLVLAVTGSVKLYAALLMGCLLFLIIFIRPIIGIYLTLMSIPLEMAGKIGEIIPSINLSYVKIFALITLITWGFQVSMKRMEFNWPKEMTLLCFYLIACLLSLPDALEFKRGLQEIALVTTTVLFFLMLINFIKNRDQLNKALVLFTIASVLTFSYAVIQRFLPGSEIKERIGWLEKGEATYGLETSGIESKTIGVVQRSTGTTAHSNVLAANTAFLTPLLFGFMRLTRKISLKLIIWAGIATCIAAAIVSLSRTGMLTYLIVLPLLVYTKIIRITVPGILLLGSLLVMSIPFLPEGVSRIFDVSNYFSSKSVSVTERFGLWDAAIHAFMDYPLNGFGIGNNRGIFKYYYNPWNQGLLTVHCSYLQVAIETGILGLITLLVFLRSIVKKFLLARKSFIDDSDEWGFTISTCLLISFVSFLIMGAIAFDFSRIGFKNMWFFMASSVVLYSISRQSYENRN